MSQAQHASAEIGKRGQALYNARIRPVVEANNRGKFLVLDIQTGEYEMDADDLTASKRLLARLPDAVLYGVRIGHRTAYRLGARREKVERP